MDRQTVPVSAREPLSRQNTSSRVRTRALVNPCGLRFAPHAPVMSDDRPPSEQAWRMSAHSILCPRLLEQPRPRVRRATHLTKLPLLESSPGCSAIRRLPTEHPLVTIAVTTPPACDSSQSRAQKRAEASRAKRSEQSAFSMALPLRDYLYRADVGHLAVASSATWCRAPMPLRYTRAPSLAGKS
jgi:hypothetical protein